MNFSLQPRGQLLLQGTLFHFPKCLCLFLAAEIFNTTRSRLISPLRYSVLVFAAGGYCVKYEREVGMFEWLMHCLSLVFIEVTAHAEIYCNWRASADNVILPIAVQIFIFCSIRSTEEKTKIKMGQVHMSIFREDLYGWSYIQLLENWYVYICAKLGLSAVILIREDMWCHMPSPDGFVNTMISPASYTENEGCALFCLNYQEFQITQTIQPHRRTSSAKKHILSTQMRNGHCRTSHLTALQTAE